MVHQQWNTSIKINVNKGVVMNLTMILFVISFILSVVICIILYRLGVLLTRMDVPIDYLNLRWKLFDYFRSYKEWTKKKNGKTGIRYYLFVVCISLTLVFILLAIS